MTMRVLRRLGPWRLVYAFGGLLFVGLLMLLILRPIGSSKGWSKDIIFDDGRDGPLMDMRLQFKLEPSQSSGGPRTLLFRVKAIGGYPMLVDQALVTVRRSDQVVLGPTVAEPVGEFGFTGSQSGYYTAKAEVPPGAYQVELLVQHLGTRLKWVWPATVKE